MSGLSASVTRILYLTGFPKELKTKDIQSAFSEYESNNGGFKIKWKDDTSLLIVFQDAAVGKYLSCRMNGQMGRFALHVANVPFTSTAKRAYLQTVAFPPAILTTSSTGITATIRPYDGPDAQTVIQTVNSRGQHTTNPSRGHNNRAASISVFPARSNSGSGGITNGRNGHHISLSHVNTNGSIPEHSHPNGGREPSPTLPNLPSHPTLNELINSAVSPAPEDPAIVHAEGPPRIGDPGKRMLGAALGVRHPGLGPRNINGGNGNGVAIGEGGVRGADQALREVQRAMGGISVAE
jgi:hypothetical protein